VAREISIGELSRQTGVKVPTIRYYEDIGLLDRPDRTVGGQRRYDAKAMDRLNFIAHGRQMGFSPDAIRSLIDLAAHPEQPCHDVDAIAAARLAEVEQRIARLERLRAELRRMLEGHRAGSVAECRIIEVLSDHGECVAEH
jgi:DNA-binding transcriptional MerR regulator